MLSERLTVELADKSYNILIGNGLLEELGALIKPLCGTEPVVVVTDENVWSCHGARTSASLSAAGVAFDAVVNPPGEENKSLNALAGLYGEFAGFSLPRSGFVIAFGGGVTGDLGGFAAATWMRGVRFIQVPTTLLAQVDSSVGGKTAVNLPQGKNMVGAFYQPETVLIDPSALLTLPPREVRNGMAEVIKYGAIRSADFFGELCRIGELRGAAGLAGSEEAPRIIYECCRIKSGIVERDERDFGERALLNFGHTFGHAIEASAGFEAYHHGEAVAFGMVIAACIGEAMGLTAPTTANSLRLALTLYGLDTNYPGSVAGLLPILTTDKKSRKDGVQMVMLKEIGNAFTKWISFRDLAAVLERIAL